MTLLQAMIVANSLDYCQAPAEVKGCKPEKKRLQQTEVCKKEEGETTMATNNCTYNEVEVQRSFLRNEATNIHSNHNRELRKAYGLRDDDPPRTLDDAVQRIKADKFEENKQAPSYLAWSDKIRWRDPTVKEDNAGYEAAETLLDTQYKDVKRTIVIKSPDEGLSAVLDFEKATFH